MKLFQIPGQLSLFDDSFLDDTEPILYLPKATEKLNKRKAKEPAKASAKAGSSMLESPGAVALPVDEDYLSKGARIETLAKDRVKSGMEGLELSALEEKLFRVERPPQTLSMCSWVQLVAKSAIRPMLRATTDFSEGSAFMQFLQKMVDPNLIVTLRRPTEDELEFSSPCRYYRRALNRTDDLLVLTIREDGVPAFSMVGYRAFSRLGRHWTELWPSDRTLHPLRNGGDLACSVSYVILNGIINRALKDPALRPTLEEKIEGNSFFQGDGPMLRQLLTDTFDDGKGGGKIFRLCKGATVESLMSWSETRSIVVIPRMLYKRPSRAFMKYLLEKTGMSEEDVLVEGTRQDRIAKFVHDNAASAASGLCRPAAWVVTKSLEEAYKAARPFEALEHGFGGFSIAEGYSYRGNADYVNAAAYPDRHLIGNSDYFRLAEDAILPVIFDKMQSRVEAVKYYKELQKSSRAAVYQTKKNIPKKTVAEMSGSDFNKSFGYVEFDEECELDKTKAVAAEFTAFKEKHFPMLDLKNVTLRFRKLGNYKAAGLYFPNLGCLCVDIGSPGSFMHELGHCLDHVYKKGAVLSEQSEFDGIWYGYKRSLESYMLTGDEKKIARLRGKTKYNLKYYLIRTEVFARCFEMYLNDVLGVETSLLQIDRKEYDFAYPVDDWLRGKIAAYFAPVLESLKASEAAEKAAA